MEFWQGWLRHMQKRIRYNNDSSRTHVTLSHFHDFDAQALTAVESGSLARLIPFTVRSVDAERQNRR